MVKNIRFSKKRLLKFISDIPEKKETEFGVFLKLGGSKGQVLGLLKQSETLEYVNEGRKKIWRKKC